MFKEMIIGSVVMITMLIFITILMGLGAGIVFFCVMLFVAQCGRRNLMLKTDTTERYEVL